MCVYVSWQIVLGEELVPNDNLIVSKRSAECPEDDEDDCTYDVDANKKDNLIYPMTIITTRRPRQYARRVFFTVSFDLSYCHNYDTNVNNDF